jgi:hypothetical protein
MRKRRHENSDLYEKSDKRSRTSKWRDENKITKKARVISAQPSIASLFKVFHFYFVDEQSTHAKSKEIYRKVWALQRAPSRG